MHHAISARLDQFLSAQNLDNSMTFEKIIMFFCFFWLPQQPQNTTDVTTSWFWYLGLCQTRKVHFRVFGQFKSRNRQLRSEAKLCLDPLDSTGLLGGRHPSFSGLAPRTAPAAIIQSSSRKKLCNCKSLFNCLWFNEYLSLGLQLVMGFHFVQWKLMNLLGSNPGWNWMNPDNLPVSGFWPPHHLATSPAPRLRVSHHLLRLTINIFRQLTRLWRPVMSSRPAQSKSKTKGTMRCKPSWKLWFLRFSCWAKPYFVGSMKESPGWFFGTVCCNVPTGRMLELSVIWRHAGFLFLIWSRCWTSTDLMRFDTTREVQAWSRTVATAYSWGNYLARIYADLARIYSQN